MAESDDDLSDPYTRRLTTPWPFLYSVIPDCGLVMNVSALQPSAATSLGADGTPAQATRRSPARGATGRGRKRASAEPPPVVLDWVAPSEPRSGTR